MLMNNADGRSPEEAAAAAARAAALAAGQSDAGEETPAMHLGMIMVSNLTRRMESGRSGARGWSAGGRREEGRERKGSAT